MRRLLVVLGLGVCAALAVAAVQLSLSQDGTEVEEALVLPQSPMPARLLVGFHDDASLRWAPDRADMLDRAREAGAAVIRTIVVWKQTAPHRPTDPADPFEAAYRLDDVDDLARSAQKRGIELLISIWGTPSWANGGQGPNHPPADARELEAFSQALADRYSGRHAGYPAVRLFSAWNEPNLEQFLAPQFDADNRSIAPALYAPIARAIYDGVKRGNPEALVAIGETSPRGHDVPSRGTVQDSHSPARFARLLSEERPTLRFDAWAQHPYPARTNVAPDAAVRWPRVGLGNLERLGESLDTWFGRLRTPLWVTEYAHETRPGNSIGIAPELQATFAAEALDVAAQTCVCGCSSGSSSATRPRTRGGAASSPRTARRNLPSPGPPATVARRDFADGARGRGASRADDELERLAVGPLGYVGTPAEAELEDPAQSVDHVRPRLFARATLAMSTGDLGNRGDDPALLALLVDDRHWSDSLISETVPERPRQPSSGLRAFEARGSCARAEKRGGERPPGSRTA